MAQLKRELAAPKARIAELEKKPVQTARKAVPKDKRVPVDAVVMERRDRMTVIRCLDPDQADDAIKIVFKQHPELARQYEAACQIFNALFNKRKMIEVP